MINKRETKKAPKGAIFVRHGMVERTGIEPVTPTMSTWCSPAELTLHSSKKYEPRSYARMLTAKTSIGKHMDRLVRTAMLS